MHRWQFPVIWSSACVCQTCRNRPLSTWSTWPVLWSEFLRLSIQFRCLLNKGYSLSSMVYQNHSTWLSSDMYSRTWKVLTNRFMIVLLFSRSVLNPLDDSLPGSSLCGFFQVGVGCRFLLQGIFLTHGSNPHLLQVSCIAGRLFTPEPLGKPLW